MTKAIADAIINGANNKIVGKMLAPFSPKCYHLPTPLKSGFLSLTPKARFENADTTQVP